MVLPRGLTLLQREPRDGSPLTASQHVHETLTGFANAAYDDPPEPNAIPAVDPFPSENVRVADPLVVGAKLKFAVLAEGVNADEPPPVIFAAPEVTLHWPMTVEFATMGAKVTPTVKALQPVNGPAGVTETVGVVLAGAGVGVDVLVGAGVTTDMTLSWFCCACALCDDPPAIEERTFAANAACAFGVGAPFGAGVAPRPRAESALI